MKKEEFNQQQETDEQKKSMQKNEMDSIKESVKMVSDAVILLNTKIQSINNTNSKDIREIINVVNEFTEYQDNKIKNYDSNFKSMKGKINSFNNVARDMLAKLEETCDKLEKGKFKEISQETEKYAKLLKDKFNKVDLDLNKFEEINSIIKKIQEDSEKLDEFNLNEKIKELLYGTEKILNRADEFEKNVSKLAYEIEDEQLFGKINEYIESVTGKTEIINDKILKFKNTLEYIIENQCAEISNTLNHISEINKEEKHDIKKFYEEYSKEKEKIELLISEDFNNIYKMVEGLKEDNKEKQNKIISYLQKYSDSITEQIEKLEEQNKDIMVNFQNIIKKSDLTIENIDSLKSVMNDFSRQFKEKDDNLIEGINGIVNEFSTIRNEAENNTNNIIEKNIELHKALDQRIEKIELSNKTGENELIKISENEKKLISLINDVAKMQEKNKNYIDYNKNEFLKEFSEIFERKIEEKLNNIDTKIMDNFKIDKEDNSKRFEILNTKIDSLEQKIIELLKENKELKEEIIKEKEKIKDKDILMNLENKAANGNDEACLKLGDMYYRGIGVVKDIDKALKYYENGQKIGNLKCQNKSFEIYKILAEKGNSKYQYLVGKAYLEGKVVNQNIDTALQWYKKSAKNGYEEAKKMVVKMYTMLAKNNNDSAMYEIGKCYYDGFCVEKDIVKAYDYFNKAAELGNVNAINILKK